MRQLLYRQGKDLCATENGITGQEYGRSGELCVTLRLDVPGLQGSKVIFAWANLRLPVKGDSFAVAKPIDDRDCGAVVPAGVVTNIDDYSVQVIEVTSDCPERQSTPLFNAFELEDPDVTECSRPAIVKYPGLSLCRLAEAIGDKSLLGCFEELLDLSVREFLPESRFFLWVEVSSSGPRSLWPSARHARHSTGQASGRKYRRAHHRWSSL